MDDYRTMVGMIESILTQGSSTMLADIMTTENLKLSEMTKNCIYFCCDPEPPPPTNELEEFAQGILSQADSWEDEYIRGIMMGILMSLQSEDDNPFNYKDEIAVLYRLLNSMVLERAVKGI